MHTSYKSARGFTLIEVLIVIAIIGILMAMLLPAIGRARTEARKAHCRNNLKQLGTSILTYNTTVGMNRLYPDNKGAACLILLYQQGTLTGGSNQLYICPTSGDNNAWDTAAPSAAADTGGIQCSYAARDNVAFGKMTDNLDPGTAIASDDFEGQVNHSDGVNVLRFDWSVQWFDAKASGVNPAAATPAAATSGCANMYKLDTLVN